MASKFGLGRGLADLEQGKAPVSGLSILTGPERVIVRHIPLNQIAPNPDQPRKTFTDSELADLASSIREQGVLQPIILRAVTGYPHSYEIVAGERRWRACQLAGKTEIPALVKTLSNENAMEVALIENVQRENLNPIEEAAAYKNLMDKCGYDMDDVSRLIGKSASYIRNSLRLIDLPDTVREMVAGGQLSASHGRALTVAENPTELAHEIIKNKMSVADTEHRVKNARRAPTRRAYTPTDIDDATIRDMQSRIKSFLGADAKITQRRGGAGQITISFKTRVQLMELVDKLSK